MKNLLFGLIATVMFGNFGFAKNQFSNVEPPSTAIRACITLSCCGLGPFGIEIVSSTYSVTLLRNIVTINLGSNNKLTAIDILNDQILAGLKSDSSENIILPKGQYKIINNEINFNPIFIAARPWCVIYSVQSNTLGNETSSSTRVCYDWIWNKSVRDGNGNVMLTPKEKEILAQNGTLETNVSKDVFYKDSNVNFTLKVGKYIINRDGNIYIQNVKIN